MDLLLTLIGVIVALNSIVTTYLLIENAKRR